ncbi:hypothetical protein DQM20_14210 [Lactiplantibacillus plantarum]|uniref:DUF1642 domain-containing protein n=1 Tax=Lactiplantibacillus plantarum TaxID=1590 RepID=UPI000E0916A7|nr:DUF1642 domain-containing protein [Lactiplantibacillus plantarum]RDG23956.1 hypothetical protein DQM20_14210 [Lactiplantibacillus plantarum]
MTKIYRKTDTIKAEQFDGSEEMINKYPIEFDDTCVFPFRFFTPAGWLGINLYDWIFTGADGEYWAVANDVFKKTYAELPVIPKVVADWIEKCKHDGTSVGDMLCSERRPEKMRDWMALTPGTYEFNQRRYKEHQELVARAWLDGYQVEEDK